MAKLSRPIALLLLSALLLGETGKSYSEMVPDTIEMTREMAIAMAIRKNLDLQIEGRYTTMAELDTVRSRAMYDPYLSASAVGGMSATPGDPTFRSRNGSISMSLSQYLPTGGSVSVTPQTGFTGSDFGTSETSRTDWQSSVGLSVNQPLLKNAGRETTEISITLADNALKDSVERFRSVMSDTVFSVINSYNRLYSLRQVLESRKAALTSAEEILNVVKGRKPGPHHAMEIVNAEYAVVQRRKELVEAERSMRDHEAHFRYLLGMEQNSRIVPTDPPSREEPLETEEQAVKTALEHRSDLKQLRSTLKMNHLQERVARRQSLPDLSVTASGGLSGNGDTIGNSIGRIGNRPSHYWSAGMQLSIPLGNTAAQTEVRRNKIRIEQVNDQIKSLEWKIKNDVEADMRALISARLQVMMAERSLQLAQQRVDEYRRNNAAGTTTIQDVLNAEKDLFSARNSHLDALETFAYAVGRLWKDTGVLLERQRVHVKSFRPGGTDETPEVSVAARSVPIEPSPVKAAEQAVPPVTRSEKKQESVAQLERKGKSPQVATGQTPESSPSETYTLKIGEYTASAAMEKAKNKVRKAGLSPVTKNGPKRENVTRLFVAEFTSQDAARKELKKIDAADGSGFILMGKKRKYQVYAGSFVENATAEKEQQRLASHGVHSSLKRVSVSAPTFLLTAGSFQSKEAALLHAEKPELQALHPVVTQNT